MIEIARGLEYLHSENIVHCDIKDVSLFPQFMFELAN